jgi:hypothetical protein
MISNKVMNLVLCMTVLLNTTQTQAQINKFSRWEIGGGISAFIYQGDLTPRRFGSMGTTKPGIILFANYKLKNQLKAQVAFALGNLKADESIYNIPIWRQHRNLSFTTPVKEIQLKVSYDIFKQYKEDEALFFPYISAGVGLGFFNIKKNYDRFEEKYFEQEKNIIDGLANDNNQKLPATLLTIPVAIGVKKMYNERINLFAELNYRFINTDFLDGFSNVANPKNQDMYYTITVGVIYNFNKNNSLKCPSF